MKALYYKQGVYYKVLALSKFVFISASFIDKSMFKYPSIIT